MYTYQHTKLSDQIVPYTECKLTVTEQQVQETRLVPRRFTEKVSCDWL